MQFLEKASALFLWEPGDEHREEGERAKRYAEQRKSEGWKMVSFEVVDAGDNKQVHMEFERLKVLSIPPRP